MLKPIKFKIENNTDFLCQEWNFLLEFFDYYGSPLSFTHAGIHLGGELTRFTPAATASSCKRNDLPQSPSMKFTRFETAA